jgi:hypothetical protein
MKWHLLLTKLPGKPSIRTKTLKLEPALPLLMQIIRRKMMQIRRRLLMKRQRKKQQIRRLLLTLQRRMLQIRRRKRMKLRRRLKLIRQDLELLVKAVPSQLLEMLQNVLKLTAVVPPKLRERPLVP